MAATLLSVILNLLLYRRKYIKAIKDHLNFFFNQPASSINFNRIGVNSPILFALLFSMMVPLNIMLNFNLLKYKLVLPDLDPFTWFCMLQLIGTLFIYLVDVWGRTSNYFTFALAPSCILTAILINEWFNKLFGDLFFASILLISLFLSLNAAKNARNAYLHITKPLLLLFEWISKQNNARIICFPAEYCRPLAYYTGKKVLYASGWEGVVWSEKYLSPMYEEVERGNMALLEKVIHSFAITHIFIDATKFHPGFLNKIPVKLLKKEKQYSLFSTAN